jgi:hypothetical protein
LRRLVSTLAVVTLAAHLFTLPITLEDLDSVNFALGVRQFDVAEHQPHPPGYPIFIAFGKLGTNALGRLGITAPEVRGLSMWSAIAAGIVPRCLFAFFRRLAGEDADDERAFIATVIAVCSPLFWFTAARPLSDLAGLAAAWASLAALASALDRGGASAERTLTPIIAGAFLAGLSIGFRSQMAILTMPRQRALSRGVRRSFGSAAACSGIFRRSAVRQEKTSRASSCCGRIPPRALPSPRSCTRSSTRGIHQCLQVRCWPWLLLVHSCCWSDRRELPVC